MISHQYPSRLLEKAVSEFAKLPGIGNKTALRMVLHLLRQPQEEAMALGTSLIELRNHIKHCKSCNNISDSELCSICSNPSRQQKLVCVVESIRDIIAIENTQQYHGIYHVLGGIISPMDGIGPSDLKLDSLEKKLEAGEIEEIILALSTTMEGDTTNFYLFRRFSKYNVPVTILARGVSVGDELEYTDEVTLGRSILHRTPYEMTNR
jgi:recombination protein RecR